MATRTPRTTRTKSGARLVPAPDPVETRRRALEAAYGDFDARCEAAWAQCRTACQDAWDAARVLVDSATLDYTAEVERIRAGGS
jgi:hypothetical protein